MYEKGQELNPVNQQGTELFIRILLIISLSKETSIILENSSTAIVIEKDQHTTSSSNNFKTYIELLS